MDLCTFADELEREIRKQGTEIREIDREVIRKNNDVCLDALILRGEDRRIAPAIYLQQLFDMHLQGLTVERIAADVVNTFRQSSMKPLPEILEVFESYDQIRERIYCRLVNRERNRDSISSLCSEDWLDLSVTYYCRLSSEDLGCGTVRIQKAFPKRWGVTEETMREDAWTNTMRDLPPLLQPLSQAMEDMGWKQPEDAGLMQLYLLSNREKVFGAVSIACPGQAEAVAKEIGGSYYMIPSSIHECLILPDEGRQSVEDLNAMVQEVNRTQVSPEEVLADHVYFYDAAEKELKPCYFGH